MSTIQILVFLHLLGAFMIAGGSILGAVVVTGIRRSRSTAGILALLNAGSRAPLLTVPGALVSIVSGSVLVVIGGRSFGELWLSIAFLAWAISVTLSLTVLGPAQSRLHALAEAELAAGREESHALLTAVRDPKMAMATHSLTTLLVLFLLLMVFKPGG